MATIEENEINRIMKALTSKNTDKEVTIQNECYVNIRRNGKDDYNVDISPYYDLDKSEGMTADELKEYLGRLDITSD